MCRSLQKHHWNSGNAPHISNSLMCTDAMHIHHFHVCCFLHLIFGNLWHWNEQESFLLMLFCLTIWYCSVYVGSVQRTAPKDWCGRRRTVWYWSESCQKQQGGFSFFMTFRNGFLNITCFTCPFLSLYLKCYHYLETGSAQQHSSFLSF